MFLCWARHSIQYNSPIFNYQIMEVATLLALLVAMLNSLQSWLTLYCLAFPFRSCDYGFPFETWACVLLQLSAWVLCRYYWFWNLMILSFWCLFYSVNIYVTLLFLYLFQLNFSYLLLILEEDMGPEFVHADACGMNLSLPLISCFGKFNISTYKYLPWQKKRKLCVNIWWVGKREGGGWLYDQVRSCAHVYYVILLNYLFDFFFS